MKGRRNGFTLIEVLVVIAIIAVLVALLLPAVQGARESARRNRCMGNMKQIATAMHTYHETHRVFPPSAIATDPVTTDDFVDTWGNAAAAAGAGLHGTSWVVMLVPFIEQDQITEKWNFKSNVKGNEPLARLNLFFMYCPSRRVDAEKERSMMFPVVHDASGNVTTSGWERGGADYGVCVGSGDVFENSVDATNNHRAYVNPNRIGKMGKTGRCTSPFTQPCNELGIFGVNRSLKIDDIIDGAAKTLLLGELQRIHDTRAPVGVGISQDGWAVGGVATSFSADHGSDTAKSGGPLNNNFFESPGSIHSGGAHFMMGDGSSRFVDNSIDPVLFENLGTAAGNEIVSF